MRWQDVTGGSQALLHLTPDEVETIDKEIIAILDRYHERNLDASLRPAGSLPIEVLLFAYPVRSPVE
jgi:hypothetical protein